MGDNEVEGREHARNAQIAKQEAIATAVQYQQLIVMKKYRKELMEELIGKCKDGSKKIAKERIKQFSINKKRQMKEKKELEKLRITKKSKRDDDNSNESSSLSESDDSTVDSEGTLIADIIGVKQKIENIETMEATK